MGAKIALILLSVIFFTCATIQAEPAVEIKAELEKINGIRVLHLHGNSYEKGYGHGYLLADEIFELLENYMLGRMYLVEGYEFTNFLLAYNGKLPPAYHIELTGLYNGIRDARGDKGIYSRKLGREFNMVDLLRWNSIEIFPMSFKNSAFSEPPAMCSSVSAWGGGTEDGSVIVARNLDFGLPEPRMEQHSLLIAYHNTCWLFPKKSWVSFGWPGFIGCLSGMNQDGVGATLNYESSRQYVEDALRIFPWQSTPVGIALREALESNRYGLFNRDPIGYILFKLRFVNLGGAFNIHLFTPFDTSRFSSDPPVAAIEINKNRKVLRTVEQNKNAEPEIHSAYFFAVTNHHRHLRDPVDCWRYERIADRLNGIDTMDIDTAFDIMMDVVQTEGYYHTLQMLGFAPDAKKFWVSFGDAGTRAYEAPPVIFQWEDIFPRRF